MVFTVILVSAKLTGGRLGRIGCLKLRGAAYLLPLFVMMELMFESFGSKVDPWIPETLYAGSFIVLSLFFIINWHIVQMRLLAVGSILNAIAIIANQGVMPAGKWAQELAGVKDIPGVWTNSAYIADAKLLFLGDVLAIPKSMGFLANVFSVGDILIYAGFAIFIWTVSHDESLDEVEQEPEPASVSV